MKPFQRLWIFVPLLVIAALVTLYVGTASWFAVFFLPFLAIFLLIILLIGLITLFRPK